MPPIEKYVEHADELAREVVKAWGMIAYTGNASSLDDDFMAVFDKARRYRDAKRAADNLREFNTLTEPDTAEERATRQAFAEAYKTFLEKHQAAA